MKVRELTLYSEKVEEVDVRNLLNQALRARIPFLGFIDLSGICSLGFLRFIIKRKANTVRFFVTERKFLPSIAPLVFPYSVSEPFELEKERVSISPKFYILSGNIDFMTFMMKENMEEMSVRVSQIFGKMFAVGSATDANKVKYPVLITNPSSFLRVDMEQHPSMYIEVLDPIPKKIAFSSRYPLFEEVGTTVGLDNFDPFQHTLCVGASGTGKTVALYILLRAIEEKYKDDVRIVILDPHGEFIRFFPNRKIVNFVDNYIEPLDVGGQKSPQMAQLITQLISSSIGEQHKYAERVLFYTVNLLSSIDQLELKNVAALLTDSSKRAEFTSMTTNDEIKRFFDEEYNDIYIHNFNAAVLPVLNFVGEYELYLGGEKKKETLLDLIEKNRTTVVSFNPHFFGERMIRFLAGAVINQMYILAITEQFKKPTLLVIDELPRVETRILKEILAETRKFNMYAYLSCQYLGQLSKEVLDSIISNMRNIIAFKLNRQDATLVSSIIEIKLEEYFKKHRSQTELEESKKEMFVKLHQREAIVRLFDGKKYILPMKLKVVDVNRWKEPGIEFKKPSATSEAPEPPSQPPSSSSSSQAPGSSGSGSTPRPAYAFAAERNLNVAEESKREETKEEKVMEEATVKEVESMKTKEKDKEKEQEGYLAQEPEPKFEEKALAEEARPMTPMSRKSTSGRITGRKNRKHEKDEKGN